MKRRTAALVTVGAVGVAILVRRRTTLGPMQAISPAGDLLIGWDNGTWSGLYADEAAANAAETPEVPIFGNGPYAEATSPLGAALIAEQVLADHGLSDVERIDWPQRPDFPSGASLVY